MKRGDKTIARKSLREERTAIAAYGQRRKSASSRKLKGALAHAQGEEREHAASFGALLRGR